MWFTGKADVRFVSPFELSDYSDIFLLRNIWDILCGPKNVTDSATNYILTNYIFYSSFGFSKVKCFKNILVYKN